MAAAVYDIPNIECRTTSVATNTTPVVAYRGAGRPEATAAAERAMDLFAAEIGMDPVDVRRKNLIAKFDEPHTTAMGQTYDCGDYDGALDRALEDADYDQLRAEQQRRRDGRRQHAARHRRQRLRRDHRRRPPIGEPAKIEIHADGTGTIYTGTSPHGQGHDTAWSMIASAQTGIDIDNFTLVWGDTDLTPVGAGTMGSRSLQQGGVAVHEAAVGLVDAGEGLAARLLEADVADVVLDVDVGAFHVAGTPARVEDVGRGRRRGRADGDALTIDTLFQPPGADVPVRRPRRGRRGRHRDRRTCAFAPRRLRRRRHDGQPDAARRPGARRGRPGRGAGADRRGALRRGRQPDHVEPRRLHDDLGRRAAEVERIPMETPTPVNPLGAKGIGESGTIGSTPAVHSAVVDALGHSACATSTCRRRPSASGGPSKPPRADPREPVAPLAPDSRLCAGGRRVSDERTNAYLWRGSGVRGAGRRRSATPRGAADGAPPSGVVREPPRVRRGWCPRRRGVVVRQDRRGGPGRLVLELNGCFAMLLRSLGFDVDLVSCRTHDPAAGRLGRTRPPRAARTGRRRPLARRRRWGDCTLSAHRGRAGAASATVPRPTRIEAVGDALALLEASPTPTARRRGSCSTRPPCGREAYADFHDRSVYLRVAPGLDLHAAPAGDPRRRVGPGCSCTLMASGAAPTTWRSSTAPSPPPTGTTCSRRTSG